MKRNIASVATPALLGMIIALASCATTSGEGWITLIDGDRGLENWTRIGDANWRPEGGAVVADGGKEGYLISKNTYRDFEIRAEFWAESHTNSGIFIRCADPGKITAALCYEVNIWDTRPEPKYGTGAIVDHAAVPVPIVYKAAGKWSTYEIVAKGPRLTVRFDGVESVNIEDRKRADGPFALQYAPGAQGAQGGPIKWRRVQIRAL